MAFKRRMDPRENGNHGLHDAGSEANRRAELAQLLKDRHRTFKKISKYTAILALVAAYQAFADDSLAYAYITNALLLVSVVALGCAAYTKRKIKELKKSKRN